MLFPNVCSTETDKELLCFFHVADGLVGKHLYRDKYKLCVIIYSRQEQKEIFFFIIFNTSNRWFPAKLNNFGFV